MVILANPSHIDILPKRREKKFAWSETPLFVLSFESMESYSSSDYNEYSEVF